MHSSYIRYKTLCKNSLLHSQGKVHAFSCSNNLPLLCLAFLLSLFQVFSCTTGCARQGTQTIEVLSAGELLRQMDPDSWKLGSEAEHLYHYLLLSEGLAEDSQAVISYALQGLLRIDPTLPVFRDSVTILLAREEYAAAEELARQGLYRYSGDTQLTLLLAAAYSENEQTPKAINLLEEHLRKKPKARTVIEELVRLYLREGQGAKAFKLLDKLPAGGPPSETDLFRAKALLSVNRNAEALALLRRVVKKRPDMLEAWVTLAFAAESVKGYDEALFAYGKAANLSPDIPDIPFRMALLLLDANRPQEALAALELGPSNPFFFTQAALGFAEAGFYDDAEKLLGKATNLGADADEMALLTSLVRQKGLRSPQAGLAPLASIRPESPLYGNALLEKTRLYLRAKEYNNACFTAREGRERFPDHKDFLGLEAFALARLGKISVAENMLTGSLKRYPNDEELLFSLGTIQDEAGKKNLAMQSMEQIISINPRNHQALNYVGYMLAERNTDIRRALALITAALEQSPNSDYIVDSLAWVQYRMGNFEESWKNINRCINLGGDDAAIWEHYGDIAQALGKYTEAVKGYSEALLREPDNSVKLREKLVLLQKNKNSPIPK